MLLHPCTMQLAQRWKKAENWQHWEHYRAVYIDRKKNASTYKGYTERQTISPVLTSDEAKGLILYMCNIRSEQRTLTILKSTKSSDEIMNQFTYEEKLPSSRHKHTVILKWGSVGEEWYVPLFFLLQKHFFYASDTLGTKVILKCMSPRFISEWFRLEFMTEFINWK